MSDFKYISPPNEPKLVKEISDIGIAPTINENIPCSLRFNGTNQYLNRTFSAGNRTTFTQSLWFKRATLAKGQWLGTYVTSAANYGLYLDVDDKLYVYIFYTGGVWQGQLITTQVFRDVSSWYHIVLSVDTTQSINTDRIKLYVNGNQVTSFSTANYPNQNQLTNFNTAAMHYFGSNSSGTATTDGYVADCYWIDGQALTPSSFGQYSNRTNNVWVPKRYLGTYGTNGFWLSFRNNSNVSSLGQDQAFVDGLKSENNFWTTNNLSTSGSTRNQTLDSPTNNFCTYNQLAKNSAVTLSNGNMILASTNNRAQGTTFVIPTTGKWYAEFIPLDAVGVGGTFAIGIIGADTNFIGGSISMITTSSGIQTIAYIDNANRNVNGTIGSSGGATYGINDIIGVAVDADNGSVSFYKNNSLQFTVSGASYTNFSGTWMFGAEASASSRRVQFNAGQIPFINNPPIGFRPLCSANLPIPIIRKPNQFFDVKTYTGTGGTQSITGINFNPSFIWLKMRNTTGDHYIWDSIRGEGPTKNLITNRANPEGYNNTFHNFAFTSNGFNITQLGAGNEVNLNGNTYVSWLWNRSRIAGFDIQTYTGNGVSNNIPHNLGVFPAMVIIKSLTGSRNWYVYHQGVGSSPTDSQFYYLNLNATAARTLGAQNWIGRGQNSINVGLYTDVVAAGENYVAYFFAEVEGFSKFGSYTGNGSADGPFVWCGFSPKYLLIKRTDAAGQNWVIFDTVRKSINDSNRTVLFAEASTAETTDANPTDIISSGFKVRNTGTGGNASGGTYIFAAFAESPFKYANAR